MPGLKEIDMVQIQLDKKRLLKYGSKALYIIEELYGEKDIIHLLNEGAKSFSMIKLIRMLYAGLIHEDPVLARDVDSGIDMCQRLLERAPGKNLMDKITYVQEKVTRAMNLSFGIDEDSSKNEETPVETLG